MAFNLYLNCIACKHLLIITCKFIVIVILLGSILSCIYGFGMVGWYITTGNMPIKFDVWIFVCGIITLLPLVATISICSCIWDHVRELAQKEIEEKNKYRRNREKIMINMNDFVPL